jgi:hypothetical protein
MRLKSLIVPGRFVEAYLYYDFLWLIAKSGETYALDFHAYLKSKFNNDNSISIFTRNDLIISSGRFLDYNSFSDELKNFINSPSIEMSIAEVESYSRIFDTRITDRSILDFRCYYGRAYVATERGIRQMSVFGRADMNHIQRGARANGQLGGERIHEAKCLQLRSYLGALTAACGSDGGWYVPGASNPDRGWTAKLSKFAEKARATEIVGGHATAVTSTDISLYSTDTRSKQHAAFATGDTSESWESRELTHVREKDDNAGRRVDETLEAVTKITGVSQLFLTRRTLFAVGENNALTYITIASKTDRLLEPTSKTLSKTPDDVLSMTSSSSGIIAETESAAFLLSGNRWSKIFDGQLYSVRGYPGSKWYRNLITAVGRDRTEMIFVS